jgi:hypothetical protein
MQQLLKSAWVGDAVRVKSITIGFGDENDFR